MGTDFDSGCDRAQLQFNVSADSLGSTDVDFGYSRFIEALRNRNHRVSASLQVRH